MPRSARLILSGPSSGKSSERRARRAASMNNPVAPTPTLPWPAEDFSVYGPVEARPVAKMQGFVGRAMHRNWVSIPHVTHHDDADVTQFEQRRKQRNAA